MSDLYDRIGAGYAHRRREDPRIAAAIHAQLRRARSLINVGAGAGSYEPAHLRVTAVESSAKMIRQRAPRAAPVVRASAEQLPFADDSFDAAMAILTVHHWGDVNSGLHEMRRVARGRIVILTFDALDAGFWLLDYFPELARLDRRQMPTMAQFAAALGPVRRIDVPIPHDCTDGMLGAFWRRPAAYLDPKVRAAMSSFARIGSADAGLQRLAADLRNGEWERRHGQLLRMETCDLGYHLVVTR